jgi:thiol:disulfide interchange protein
MKGERSSGLIRRRFPRSDAMGSSKWVLSLVPALILPLATSLGAQEREGPAGYYVVSDYDETRDPAEDLQVAVERAQKEGKRILIQVGGEWCGWCKLLDGFIHDHPSVSDLIASRYLIMKVNWSRENHNEAFLGQYPRITGYPHLFVLETDGSLLHSQNTAELEEGRSYNEQVMVDFLQKWAG